VNKEHGTRLTVDGILSLDGISFSTLHGGSTTTGSKPLERPKLGSQYKSPSTLRRISSSTKHLSSPRTPEEIIPVHVRLR
jgi:hypothetical protein